MSAVVGSLLLESRRVQVKLKGLWSVLQALEFERPNLGIRISRREIHGHPG